MSQQNFAKRYLQTYFTKIDPDERAIIKFLVKNFQKIKGKPNMLEVGCGPGIQHVLPSVPYVKQIYLTDFLKENIIEIEKWRYKKKGAHDWRKFTKYTLSLEKNNTETINNRERKLRNKISYLGQCNVLNKKPVKINKKFGVVGFFYCAEVVTEKKIIWDNVLKKVTELIDSNGHLFMVSVLATHYYVIENDDGSFEKIPTMYLLKRDFRNILQKLNYNLKETAIEIIKTPSMSDHGITSIILICAKKN